MRITPLLIFSLFPALSFAAQDNPGSLASSKCHVTPSVKAENYPGKDAIISSNNLAMPAGKAVSADGQKVYISGRVLDKNCVPVSDAIVEIWQEDPEGKYVAASLGERMDPYPVFAGSGRAITDNLGRFNFITLFPGTKGGHAPHINFHVTHENFTSLNTQMFFANDTHNHSDYVLKNIPPSRRKMLEASVSSKQQKDGEAVSATWEIILDGQNRFRKF